MSGFEVIEEGGGIRRPRLFRSQEANKNPVWRVKLFTVVSNFCSGSSASNTEVYHAQVFALSVIFGTENFLFIWCADVSRSKPPEIFLEIASPLSYQTILPYILLTPFSPKLLWYGGLRRFDFSGSVIWLRASVSSNLCFSINRGTLAHRIKKTLKGAKISVIVNWKFGDSWETMVWQEVLI